MVKIMYKGVTLHKYCKKHYLDYHYIYNNLVNKGLTIEEAIEKYRKYRDSHRVSVLYDESIGVTLATVYARIEKLGWSKKEALTRERGFGKTKYLIDGVLVKHLLGKRYALFHYYIKRGYSVTEAYEKAKKDD